MYDSAVVVFQPPNRVGLGHINRLAAIALALRGLDPRIRVPFVVEGASHSLIESYGLPHLAFPSREELSRSGRWDAWDSEERSRLAMSLAKTMLSELRADLVVFDCFPSEEFAAAAIESGVPTALCLRKGKGWDDYLNIHRVRMILPHVETILAPHEPGAYDVPEALQAKLVFVGEIVRTMPLNPGRFGGITKGKLVVITGGGGGFPGTVQFYNLALRAVAVARQRRPDISVILLAGPLFADWLKLELVDGVRVVPFDPQASSLFASANLVISQAGYNSMAELASIGTQTICVPAERQFDDQFGRAAAFAKATPHIHLLEAESDSGLGAMIDECLARDFKRTIAGGTRGALNAANVLYSLVSRICARRREQETSAR